MTMPRTVFRTCTLCEAMCGLKLELDGDRIVSVRGDEDDPFSQGYICPKGVAIGEVHHDPDRLRTPLRRASDGSFAPIGWDEAFGLVEQRLLAVRASCGADAIAVYLGNPIIHNYGAILLRAGFARAVGSRNFFGAGSQDTSPRWAVSYLLYGSSLVTPVPDIDRTQYFLCVGANPWISNGSLMTAPDVRRRLRAIRQRSGRIVVVDPRRTETAREADEWIAIRPGGDAALLIAMVQTLIEDGRIDEHRINKMARGWIEIRQRLAAFTPERVAAGVGIDARTIRRLAHEFADAPTSVVYSRVGTCNNRFGTIATWATDLLNLVAGRMGEVGGAMLPTPAINISALSPYFNDGYARWRSRLRKLPETFGELPTSVLAEEIETDGPGQVKALIIYAGNPVLSAPNGQRLAQALSRLDFMVAIDLRSSNSWMHNIEALVSGRERCVLLVHPHDAERAGVRDGETAMLESRVFRGPVPVHVTDEMMQGVVSLPHGWGHRDVGRWQKVAGSRAGVSVNDWTDDGDVEVVVGQSILNGIPVQLKPAISVVAGE